MMALLRTLTALMVFENQRSGMAQAHIERLRPGREISGALTDNLSWASEDHNPTPTDHHWPEIVIAVVMAVIEIVKVVMVVE